MINVFIGYDDFEPIAFHTCMHSIMSHTTEPLFFVPLKKENLPINIEREGSTDFTRSRFLVPLLSNFEGYSIFIDCDFIFKADIKELLKDIDKYALRVCKHKYKPKNNKKFNNHKQSDYEMKNWSSLMVFNNDRCIALDKDTVQNSSLQYLHQFEWVDHNNIGEIPLNYNYLVGEDNQVTPAKGIHYTNGGPWFPGCKNTDYSSNWLSTFSDMTFPIRKTFT